jgi:RNA polymerase sigma factor (sigma-70 family)
VKLSFYTDEGGFIPTRESLLSRLKDHDDSASWKQFFDLYWRLIYSVARKSGLTEIESQEVLQETLITVSKRISGFKYDPKVGSFKGWLLHTTRWRINDQLRKRQRDNVMDHHGSNEGERSTATIERIPDPGQGGFDGVWEEEWSKNLMDLAIQRVKQEVKPRQYQIFDLYVVKKWPIGKVTSTLKINSGQVYLAKHRVGSLIKKQVRTLQRQLA